MIFYHGTSIDAWKKIQDEGVLWGTPRPRPFCPTCGNKQTTSYRHTYLTPHEEIAREYGNVLLQVEYTPRGIDGSGTDNYGFKPPPGQSCWQFAVFIPIDLAQVTRLDG